MRIGIIRYPGSNCDFDTLRYFNFNNSFFIWHKDTTFPASIDLLVIPGGFAFGDRVYNKATEKYEISPGEMALKSPVTKIIKEAVSRKIPILGICNGFQILVKMGLLPGKLLLNSNKQFICTKMTCTTICEGFDSVNTKLYIANSYGQYVNTEPDSCHIFLKYTGDTTEIGSEIAGISNRERTIFGMMPHPERNNNDFKELLYNIIFKTNVVYKKFATNIETLLCSEHISYKSTRKFLKKLPTKAPWVIQGPGENAGIVHLDKDYCIAIRIESHNHPTFIHPYEGAATGVGGIMRDIFTMGARPLAILDFLRFGTDENSDKLLDKTIKGISYYGNCIGVPNVGGDLYRSEIYNKNPLVNIGCLGLVKKNNIVYGNALNKNRLLIYVGSKTGAEGINGAAMASTSFSKTDDLDMMLDNVQKSDPFLGKLLLEACCEIADLHLAEGMQDLGAGGLLCATYEVVNRGRIKQLKNNQKPNLGCEINIDKIPIKYKMDPCDILISESQERMLIVSTYENKQKIFDIFEKWDLEYAEIGVTTDDSMYSVYNQNTLLYFNAMNNFSDLNDNWKSISSQNITCPQKIKCMHKWKIYDSTIGNRTIKGPDTDGSYAILDIYEINKKIYLTWSESIKECNDQLCKLNAKPLCVVNCLNFGHPRNSMTDFSNTIDKMIYDCRQLNIPVVGGNVSLYNSTDGISIRPTPIMLVLGIQND